MVLNAVYRSGLHFTLFSMTDLMIVNLCLEQISCVFWNVCYSYFEHKLPCWLAVGCVSIIFYLIGWIVWKTKSERGCVKKITQKHAGRIVWLGSGARICVRHANRSLSRKACDGRGDSVSLYLVHNLICCFNVHWHDYVCMYV